MKSLVAENASLRQQVSQKDAQLTSLGQLVQTVSTKLAVSPPRYQQHQQAQKAPSFTGAFRKPQTPPNTVVSLPITQRLVDHTSIYLFHPDLRFCVILGCILKIVLIRVFIVYWSNFKDFLDKGRFDLPARQFSAIAFRSGTESV